MLLSYAVVALLKAAIAVPALFSCDKPRFYRRFLALAAGSFLKLNRISVTVEKSLKEIKRPCIFACSYTSGADWAVMLSLAPDNTIFVAESVLFKPPFSWLTVPAGFIPAPEKAGLRSSYGIHKKLSSLTENMSLLVFINREIRRDRLAARKGAAYFALKTGLPVLPVGISHKKDASRGRDREITVKIGDPIIPAPSGDLLKNTQELTEIISGAVSRLMCL